MTTEEEGKAEFIEAFFDDLRDRVKLTLELWNRGYHNEALLLITCYIDGLGQWLYPSNSGSSETFVRVLREYGNESHLLAVLPGRLGERLPRRSGQSKLYVAVHQQLAKLNPGVALSEENLVNTLSPTLSPKELNYLRSNIWRGTVASVAYESLRSLNVHMHGSAGAITFSATSFQGRPLEEVGYHALKRALDQILEHAASISRISGKWFGYR